MTSLPPFQQLLDEHGLALWGVCRRAGPGAEDCFQETVLAALRAYPCLRDARNLRGWLLTIGRHTVVDYHREGARQPRATEDAILDAVPAAAAEPADPAVWTHVAALPSRQAAALAHRFGADLAYREVAARMGCSEEAARRSVFEGLRRLRTEVTR